MSDNTEEIRKKSEKANRKPIKTAKGGILYPGRTYKETGRPKKIPKLEELYLKHLTEEKDGLSALDAILLQLRNKAIKGDMKAIEYLLNRIYGKPKESIDQKTQETEIIVRFEKDDNNQI